MRDEDARRIGIAGHAQRISAFLPGRQHHLLARKQRAEQRLVIRARQQTRRQHRRDKRFRGQAAGEFFGKRNRLTHAKTSAAGGFIHRQADPAEFAHLGKNALVKTRRHKAQTTHALAIPAARRHCTRAIANHADRFRAFFQNLAHALILITPPGVMS